jgi:hypothetical protein
MRIVRVTAQNVWRLEQIERTPEAPSWTSEAEEFLLDGRAVAHLRRAGTVKLRRSQTRPTMSQDLTDGSALRSRSVIPCTCAPCDSVLLWSITDTDALM